MMARLILTLTTLIALALPLRAELLPAAPAQIVTDAGFAPVARQLVQRFVADGGAQAEVLTGPPGPGADLYLAPDAASADALIGQGQASPEGRLTYATGAAGPDGVAAPRDAVVLSNAPSEAVARDFLVFLQSPEAWDMIVAAGFGAY